MQLKRVFVWVFGVATLIGVLYVRKAYNDIRGEEAAPSTAALVLPKNTATAVRAEPADAVFMGLSMGADEAAILGKFGSQLKKLEKRQQFFLAYVDYTIPDYVLDGVRMEAFFQMDNDTHRLAQVLLRKMAEDKPLGIYRADFDALLSSLTSTYGAPQITVKGKPDDTFHDNRNWVNGNTEIELSRSQTVHASGQTSEMLTIRFFPAD